MLKEKKMVEEVREVAMMLEKEVRQPIIEAKALIEAVISSVEVATPLVSVSLAFLFLYPYPYTLICLFICNSFFQAQPMFQGLGDIDKLLEDVFFTL